MGWWLEVIRGVLGGWVWVFLDGAALLRKETHKIPKGVLKGGDMEAVGCETAWGCCGRWYDSGCEDRSGFEYLGDTAKKRSTAT